MNTPHSIERDFLFDQLFSLEPYQDWSEAMSVIGISLLAAAIVPFIIVFSQPLWFIGALIALMVSLISSFTYIYHDLNGHQQYLEDNKEYYTNLHRITTVLVCISLFPPITWSIVLIGIALGRGIAALWNSCDVDSNNTHSVASSPSC